MYNLLVHYDGWPDDSGSLPRARVFEYTDPEIKKDLLIDGEVDLRRVKNFPTLFISESQDESNQLARIGTIVDLRINGLIANLEYHFDKRITPITYSVIEELSGELQIESFEFSRTHWAVKNADLFKILFLDQKASPINPKVFSLSNDRRVEKDLVSVMMPFDVSFNEVFSTLKATASTLNMRCLRADDIWDHDAIIQDVVSLVSRSRIVICDCTGRNANVFYEAGIAHTLGRDVILITQSKADIPFDLRHLRYIEYLNNSEGRSQLAKKLNSKIENLIKNHK